MKVYNICAKVICVSFIHFLLFGCNATYGEKNLTVRQPENESSTWPLTVAEGEISCERKELIRNSGSRDTALPLVKFTSAGGVFGINGARKESVGAILQSKNSCGQKNRDTDTTIKILNSWLKAGLALCDGDIARAQLALDVDTNETGVSPLSNNIRQDQTF